MDSDESSEHYIDPDYNDWETNYRRDYIEGDRASLLQIMCESFGSEKEARNDIARRERMAKAMYDIQSNTPSLFGQYKHIQMCTSKTEFSSSSSRGKFRKLFTASPGMTMVGADLSGIELRMLAHYLGRYDGGRYADILLKR